MKKILFPTLVLCMTVSTVFAQKMRPLVGNGVAKTYTMPIAAFEHLEVLWVGGNITVEFGASTSDLSIETDENLFQLLQFKSEANTLRLEVPNNKQNRLWVEDNKTQIRIRTTAQASQIQYEANANTIIRNMDSKQLSVTKSGNGKLTLEGKAATLRIEQSDNGNLDASKLIVATANVSVSGNGDLDIHATVIQKQTVRGNGGVSNVASDGDSRVPKVRRVRITFCNPQSETREYHVSGINERGRKFSYGLSLEAMERQTEYLPIGTTVRRNGKIVATLKASDDQQDVHL